MYRTHCHPVALNEWGDFFAGFFRAARLSLACDCYLQQGEELKHSTEALKLQAEELKHSVEQQTKLVEVSRQQLQQEHMHCSKERERRRDSERPKFCSAAGRDFEWRRGPHLSNKA
jgi:hypothetical protein